MPTMIMIIGWIGIWPDALNVEWQIVTVAVVIVR